MRTIRSYAWEIGLGLALAAALLATYGFTVFGQSQCTRFTWVDDDVVFIDNPHLQTAWDLRGLATLATHPYYFDWTPLYWLVLWLERGLFGNTAVAYRSVSLVLFWTALLILFRLLARGTGRKTLSACLVLVFAVHPMLAECVVWPTTQKTIISLLLALLALQAYDRLMCAESSRQRHSAWLRVFLIALAAMGVKLTGLVLPFGLAAYDLAWQRQACGRRLTLASIWGTARRTGVLMLLAGCWAAYSQLVVFRIEPQNVGIDRYLGNSLAVSLATHAVIELRTLGHWIAPHGLCLLYAYRTYQPTDWQPWLALAVVAAALGGLIAVAPAERRPLAAFGVAWYVLQRAITAGLFPYQWCAMANRYSTVAGVGLVLLAALALSRAPALIRLGQFRYCVYTLACAAVLLCGAWSRLYATLLTTHIGARLLGQPGNVRFLQSELMTAYGTQADRLWEQLSRDPASRVDLGRWDLAQAAVHWAKERYRRGLGLEDAEVIRLTAGVPHPYGLLLCAHYFDGTGRPERVWPLVSQALKVETPRFRAWLAGVKSDVQAGRTKHWRRAYLSDGDGDRRLAELRCWSLMWQRANELAPDADGHLTMHSLGCGLTYGSR